MKKGAWIGAGAGGALLLLFLLNPSESGLFPPCPFRSLTGLLCPGCGTLRGIHHLLHGRMGMAFSLNPLMVISLPLLMAGVIIPRVRPGTRLPAACVWMILAGILAFGVIRNLPLA